jgi:hypothetical protein
MTILNFNNTERTLKSLEKHRALLGDKLVQARAEAEAAATAQKAHMRSDKVGDEKIGRQLDDRLLSAERKKQAITSTLSELDGEIRDAKAALAEQRNRQERDKACAELSANVNTLQTAIGAYKKAGAGLIDAIKPLASLPGVAPDFRVKMEGVIPETAAAATQLASDVQAFSERVASGQTRAPGVRAEPEKLAPLPHISKRDVYLLQDSKWQEHGETKTAARYGTAALPLPIVERVIAKGLGHDASSPIVEKLRAMHGDRRAVVVAMECVDLETGERPAGGVKYESDSVDSVPVIGPAVVGVASISAA